MPRVLIIRIVIAFDETATLQLQIDTLAQQGSVNSTAAARYSTNARTSGSGSLPAVASACLAKAERVRTLRRRIFLGELEPKVDTTTVRYLGRMTTFTIAGFAR